jgi:hypothetical protein
MRNCSALIGLLIFLVTGCSDESVWTREQRTNAQNVFVAINEAVDAARLSNSLSRPGVSRQ